ncbi:MAG TPA: MXAN_2562 family outer membrane beta-barrel protein [Polyangia bacterium]
MQKSAESGLLAWFRVAALGATLLGATTARGQTTSPPTLGAGDFTLTLTRPDGHSLTTDELVVYFSHARCSCPANLTATLAISSDAAAMLTSADTVDAQFMIGNDCDNVQATACTAVGSVVTLSADDTAADTSVPTSAVFNAAASGNCNGATTSTRLWAIVRVGGTRLTTEPSVALTVGGTGPSAPTGVTTVSADEGLVVSWTAASDTSTVQGYQVLCMPGPATPAAPAYDDSCSAAAPDGGAGLDPQFLCSGLIGVGTNSARVHGLTNGSAYQIAVVAIGIDGTPSGPSAAAPGTPAPSVGFGDLYKDSGGTAMGGCAVAGRGSGGVAFGLALAGGLLIARRRRRRRWAGGAAIVLLMAAAAAATRPAAAAIDDGAFPFAAAQQPPPGWNVELRFGPYRPNVDSEFAARGQSVRPYEQVFGSSQHLMMQLEIDRQLSRRAGTWAAGFAFGYYNVTAAALSADLQTRSGDETGLRLIPLSLSLVYRADTLRRRFGSPVVPYAKAGLDCTLWRISDTSQADFSGRTFGWNAAAGVTLDLSPLDPEAAASLKHESGVDQLALFAEVAYFRLDGFGSDSALRVGDTTWFAGLMLEF